MVNDNQIIEDRRLLTHEATTLFIREEIGHNAPPELYDLDQEFANTKHNRNKVITISLIVFTTLSIAAAYGVTRYIEYQNSRIPISIDAFEDVNLREIFDTAKKHEKEMQDARRDLEDLYQGKEAAINALKESAERKKDVVETENPPDKAAQLRRIDRELEENIKIEEAVWDAEIAKVQARIDRIQEDIDSYDTRILEKAKEQEELINNQQKRFDMEMEKSVEYYEKKIQEIQEGHASQLESINRNNQEIIETIKVKHIEEVSRLENLYNPELDDDFDFLVDYEQPELKQYYLNVKNINPVIFDEEILDKDNVQARLDQLVLAENTFKKLREIPYYNFPDSALQYLETQYNRSVGHYAQVIKNVAPVIEGKNSIIEKRNALISSQYSELEQIDFFLKSYVKGNRINGVIIDPRPRNMKVYIDPIYEVYSNTVGFVFRNDSDFIGTIKFKEHDGNLVAVIDQLLNKDRGIKSFDMILIQLVQE